MSRPWMVSLGLWSIACSPVKSAPSAVPEPVEASSPEAAEPVSEIMDRARALAEARDLQSLLALHEAERSRLEDPAAAELDLLVADLLADYAYGGKEGGSLERALQMASAVRARLPEHLRAHTLAAGWLVRAHRATQARPLAEKALAIAPDKRLARRQYWEVVFADPKLSEPDRKAELVPQIEALVAGDPEPWDLYDAAEAYGRLDLDDARDRLWERIESEHPESEAADYVAWDRIDLLSDQKKLQEHQQGKANPALAAELEQRYRRIIADPEHRPPFWRGRAYVSLFFLLREREDEVDPEDLRQVVDGIVEHESMNHHIVYGLAPLELAKRTPYHDRALEIVEQGLASVENLIDPKRYPDERKREEGTRYLKSQFQLTKAAILIEAGRLDEAEALVERARAEHGARPEHFATLGAADEKREDLDAARAHYVEGIALEANALRRPCTDALERLYVAKRGSKRGLKRYMARLTAEQQQARKDKVLADVVADAPALRAFELDSLQGRTVESESLDGKVAVVHFWATWCGFCVVELKAIAELVDKYSSDREVEIVLVSANTNPEKLEVWMKNHGFGFDTLLGAQYSTAADIHTWPTTLFVDRQGRVVYRHAGATSDLVEEFSWRIDALKKSRDAP